MADDLTKLITDSGLVLVGKIGTVGVGFIAHTLLVRNLGPASFGAFSLALTIVSVFAGFAAIGMGQATTRFISAADSSEIGEYITVCLSFVLVTGPIFALTLYFFNGYIEMFFGENNLGYFLRLLSILVVLRLISKVIHGIVRGFKLTKAKVINFDLIPLFLSLPILYFFISIDKVILGAAIYYLIRPVTQIILLTASARRSTELSFSFSLPSRRKISDVFSFSWPLAFESLVAIFLGSVDILMLGRLATSELVGQYRSIQPVAKTLLLLIQVLTFIYLPIATEYFEENRLDELDVIYKTATRWVAHMTFPLLLFYVLFGGEFINVMFGNEYTVAYSALAILSFGMYSRVVIGPNAKTIQAIDRTREDLFASLGGLLTNIALNYYLIPIYGLEGAALATLSGYLVYNAIELIIIYAYADVGPFHMSLFTPFVPTALVWLFLVRMNLLSADTLFSLILIGIAISVTHILSIFFTTGFTEKDRMLLDAMRKN